MVIRKETLLKHKTIACAMMLSLAPFMMVGMDLDTKKPNNLIRSIPQNRVPANSPEPQDKETGRTTPTDPASSSMALETLRNNGVFLSGASNASMHSNYSKDSSGSGISTLTRNFRKLCPKPQFKSSLSGSKRDRGDNTHTDHSPTKKQPQNLFVKAHQMHTRFGGMPITPSSMN